MQLLAGLVFAPVDNHSDERIIECVPYSGYTCDFTNVIRVHVQHIGAKIKNPLAYNAISRVLPGKCRRIG